MPAVILQGGMPTNPAEVIIQSATFEIDGERVEAFNCPSIAYKQTPELHLWITGAVKGDDTYLTYIGLDW